MDNKQTISLVPTSTMAKDLFYIALFGFLVLGASLGIGFFFDDIHNVERAIQMPWTLQGLTHSFTVFDPSSANLWCIKREAVYLFRPLLMLSLKLDYYLYGLATSGFHFTNVFLHIINGWLVYLILLSLGFFSKKARLGAILFVLFPHNTVSVIWISGRTELLLATFLLASIYLYARSFRSSRSFLLQGFALLMAVAALLTKESAVALPGYLLGVEFIFSDRTASLRERLKPVVLRLFPFVLLIGAYLVYRFFFFGSFPTPPKPYYYPPSDPEFWVFLPVKTVYYFFAWLTNFPVFPVEPVSFLRRQPILLGLAIVVTIWGWYWVIKKLKGERSFWGLSLWLFSCQVPVAMVMASNHYLYMGNIAVAAMIALLFYRNQDEAQSFSRKKRWLLGILLFIYLIHQAYGLLSYYALSLLPQNMSKSMVQLQDGKLAKDTEVYLLNIPFSTAHSGQRLRLFYGAKKLTTHVLSLSNNPFGFGKAPKITWRDKNTMVVQLHERLLKNQAIKMFLRMGVELKQGKTYQSKEIDVTLEGDKPKEIHRLIVRFKISKKGKRRLVVLFQPKKGKETEALWIRYGKPTKKVTFLSPF